MADPVEAELYLRRQAERALQQGEREGPFGGTVSTAATALVAVGALTREVAAEVMADHSLALFLRERGAPSFHSGQGVGVVAALNPPRVVACDAVVDLPAGQLTVLYVALRADSTIIAVSGDRPMTHLPGNPFPQVSISDDQGQHGMAMFSGSEGAHGIEGTLEVSPGLARNTSWLDLGGSRIPLSPSAPAEVSVSLEPLPQQEPALAHLWRQIAGAHRLRGVGFHGPGPDLEGAIDALAAVDAVDRDSPELAQVRAVASALTGQGLTGPLPEPWQTLIRNARRSPDQRTPRTAALGVATPAIDGVVVVIEAVTWGRSGLTARVEASPAIALGGAFSALGVERLTWWAEDDLGGVYLGGVITSQTRPEYSAATVEFWPALDPLARELRLMPTGTSHRAVVRVALAAGTGP